MPLLDEKTGSLINPWRGVAPARSFLNFLAGDNLDRDFLANEAINETDLAHWLIDQGLGPLAFARCRNQFPCLADLLQLDAFSAAAENALHWQNLELVTTNLSSKSIPVVVLKGAALADSVYDLRDRRTMSDIDLWLLERDFRTGCEAMQEIGFLVDEKEDRPIALQMLSDGERQFSRPELPNYLVELHLSPFSGWWLKRTAAVDKGALWSRIEPLGAWNAVFQLGPEDTIIHLAVHLVINHQCGLAAVRSLMDMALTLRHRQVNWQLLVLEAKRWRVGTAVWFALNLLQQLFTVPEVGAAVEYLQPGAWRQKYLQNLMSPEAVLSGVDLRSGRKRLIFLLLMVDRLRDMINLIIRTIWPERQWLDARYGEHSGIWHHFHRITHGEI